MFASPFLSLAQAPATYSRAAVTEAVSVFCSSCFSVKRSWSSTVVHQPHAARDDGFQSFLQDTKVCSRDTGSAFKSLQDVFPQNALPRGFFWEDSVMKLAIPAGNVRPARRRLSAHCRSPALLACFGVCEERFNVNAFEAETSLVSVELPCGPAASDSGSAVVVCPPGRRDAKATASDRTAWLASAWPDPGKPKFSCQRKSGLRGVAHLPGASAGATTSASPGYQGKAKGPHRFRKPDAQAQNSRALLPPCAGWPVPLALAVEVQKAKDADQSFAGTAFVCFCIACW